MKTSSFREYTGDKGVAICIYPPIDWSGMRYPSLEPDRQAFYAIKNGTITNEQYEELYRKNILSKLDPQKVYDQLKDAVLLCWETNEKYCHRRIVAKWLEENLGVEVPEWNKQDEKIEQISKDKSIKPLF